MQGNSHSNTLFVGGLPATFTNAELEELFGEVGPMKRCFVVNGKRVGYVTYAFKEDADQALAKIKSIDGKRLNVRISNKKPSEKETKKNKKSDEVDAEKSGEKPSKPVNGKSSNKNAANRRPNKKPKSQVKKSPTKAARLIVRNLPFKAEKEDLLKEFSKYGNVLEVSIPTKSDGKKLGFGFVQFDTQQEAVEALKNLNAKKLMGRPIAVDHAIPLKEYINLKKDGHTVDDDESENSDDDEDEKSNDEECNKSEDDMEDLSDEGSPAKTKNNKNTREEVVDFTSNNEDDDNATPKDIAELVASSDSDGSEDKEMDTDDEDEEKCSSDEDDDEEEEDDEDDNKNKKSFKKNKNVKSDVDEGKTLFIRNLNFSTTNDKLKEVFSQFGELEYVTICVDPVTVHSKGSGFVKFKSKEDAERCLRLVNDAPKDSGGIVIDDFKINLSSAVSRNDLRKQKEKETLDKKKCNRNLYLSREGLIRRGTKAAEGVSNQDLDKREQLDMWKRQMLKNLHMFISETRLCVRNLPPNVTDAKLRKIFQEAAGKKTEITESRVMRHLHTTGEDGCGVSKGYGFVNFTTHEAALRALRQLNNNPNTFTPIARPIVEFSIENKAALKAKQKRLEKSAANKNAKNHEKLHDSAEQEDNEEEDDDDLEFSGAKSDVTRYKKGLPSHTGPKIRHGKISRNFLKRQKNSKKTSRKQRRAKIYHADSQIRNSDNKGHVELPRKRKLNLSKGKASKKAKCYGD